jgi:hypothetical protein
VFSRRFALLAGVLVTLNLVLWLAAPGLALRKGLVNELFGRQLIRGEAIYKSAVCGGTDCRFDRGVITDVTPTQLTLREADGRVQPIPISGSTDVVKFGRHISISRLARRWHVFVTWPTTGPAQSVDVEKVPLRRVRSEVG